MKLLPLVTVAATLSQLVSATLYAQLNKKDSVSLAASQDISSYVASYSSDSPLVIMKLPVSLNEQEVSKKETPFIHNFMKHARVYDNADLDGEQVITLRDTKDYSWMDVIDTKSTKIFEIDVEHVKTAQQLDSFMDAVNKRILEDFKSFENLVVIDTEGSDDEVETASKSKHEDDVKPVPQTIWTEGLLSCLIVGLVLLAILVIAMQWIMALDISYGALEPHQAGVQKKTQ